MLGVSGFGFRVLGFGFRVSGFVFRVSVEGGGARLLADLAHPRVELGGCGVGFRV